MNETRNSSYAGGPTIKKGDAYFIQTKDFSEPGLEWQTVVVQKVNCGENQEVNVEKFTCEVSESVQGDSSSATDGSSD